MILVVVDNSGTAMTGFQPHPGTPSGAAGGALPAVDIPAVCRAMGAEVVIADPFEMAAAGRTVRQVVGDAGGVRVLVLRQACALSPGKKGKKLYDVSIDPQTCLGQECGCNRLCTRVFRCPGLIWDPEEGVTRIDEVICVGCGVCADICPSGAIRKEEVA
jgi:indolepyruvate ferredoxin oxidoreductase alpha subunit